MQILLTTSWFYWDPPREAFTLPFLDHPIMWYGILFVVGFILGYFIILSVFNRILQDPSIASTQAFPATLVSTKEKSQFLADRLCWFLVLGTLIGARLGAVFFYNWPYFRLHPVEIIKVWKGGLASHGGTIGILLALYLYRLYIKKWLPSLSFLRLVDCVAIPVPLAGFFIRLGNFMNQEIIGTPTQLPWGIIFGHPADGSFPLPRHPVQLYEALCYLIIFFIMYGIWKKRGLQLHEGALAGLLLILIFSSRFILEFWKETMEASISLTSLQMGQILSIPFIALGFYFLFNCKNYKFYKKG